MFDSLKKWVVEKLQEWVCRDAQESKNDGEDSFYADVEEEDVGYENPWSLPYYDDD